MSQLVPTLIISTVVLIAAIVAAVKCKPLRAAISGVAGAAFVVAVTSLLFLVADKEGRRNIKVRGLVKEMKDARKSAEADKEETEEAISAEVEEEVAVHEEAKEEQEELAKPKKKRTRLKG